MKTIIKVLPVIIVALFSSCKSSSEKIADENTSDEKWYVGEWVYEGPQEDYLSFKSFYITEDWEFIAEGFREKLEKFDDGPHFKLVDGYLWVYEQEKEMYIADFEGSSVGPYRKHASKVADRSSSPKEKSSKKSDNNSDNAWKSAFDNEGYLVLQSDKQYTKQGITSYFYVVLKGYGTNYKRGKVTVHSERHIINVGIYDYDDGVLIYPEFYTATGYPAEYTAIEGRIFNVEFSPTISITEYEEPDYRGGVAKIKYSKIGTGNLTGYKNSYNPHPRHY